MQNSHVVCKRTGKHCGGFRFLQRAAYLVTPKNTEEKIRKGQPRTRGHQTDNLHTQKGQKTEKKKDANNKSAHTVAPETKKKKGA